MPQACLQVAVAMMLGSNLEWYVMRCKGRAGGELANSLAVVVFPGRRDFEREGVGSDGT